MPKEVLSDIENRLKFRNLEKNVFLFGASYRQGVGDTRFSASEFVYNYF